MTTVAIHTHSALPLQPFYLVFQLAELWRRAGIRVEVVAGATPVPSARVALLHVDLTRVPEDYVALRRSYPVVLNGSVVDIGKHLLKEGLVQRDDPYDGPVIVKTDLNCRGIPERIAKRRAQSLTGRIAGTLLDHLWSARPTGRMWHKDYPVFPNRASVPGWIWARSDLVVQRFVPERVDRGYALRQWTFFGDGECHLVRYAPTPLFERGTVTGTEAAGRVPSELCALRAAMGFDFGKFEYFLYEGRPLVIDVNKTPSYNAARSRLRVEALPGLADGLKRWL